MLGACDFNFSNQGQNPSEQNQENREDSQNENQNTENKPDDNTKIEEEENPPHHEEENQEEEEEIKWALGLTENTHDLAEAQAKAQTSLQYTVALRDKFVAAYKEIMQIQI